MTDISEACACNRTWSSQSQTYTFTRLLDWETSDASGDADNDTLTNLQEFQHGTDPRRADSDYGPSPTHDKHLTI